MEETLPTCLAGKIGGLGCGLKVGTVLRFSEEVGSGCGFREILDTYRGRMGENH